MVAVDFFFFYCFKAYTTQLDFLRSHFLRFPILLESFLSEKQIVLQSWWNYDSFATNLIDDVGKNQKLTWNIWDVGSEGKKTTGFYLVGIYNWVIK